MSKIKVLVCDDSAVMRQVMQDIFSKEPSIEYMGAAADPLFAMEKMKKEWPDVIVLDVEMPRMDGITFLKEIMSTRPTPVVICSTLVGSGTETALQAMRAGAAEIIAKPKVGLKDFLQQSSRDLVRAVRAAAAANAGKLAQRIAQNHRAVLQSKPAPTAPVAPGVRPMSEEMSMFRPKYTADVILSSDPVGSMAKTTERVIVIGSSTGGTQALEEVLVPLSKTCCGIAIVQHMPEAFTSGFARRLNELCQIEVREAKTGDRIVPGVALIAPGGKHLLLSRSGAYYFVEVKDGPQVNRHKPSVDVLFRSAAKFAGSNALGVILTGMGDDGARGLKEMLDAGARTVAQDEASCIVFGMPKEAIKLGAAQKIQSLDDIPATLMKYSTSNTI